MKTFKIEVREHRGPARTGTRTVQAPNIYKAEDLLRQIGFEIVNPTPLPEAPAAEPAAEPAAAKKVSKPKGGTNG